LRAIILQPGFVRLTLHSFTIIVSHLYKGVVSLAFSWLSPGYLIIASVSVLEKAIEVGV